jgi:SAM-dependent methyltransferase
VLEFLPDPWRCVEEIHRALKPDGVVYSEVPFMQQVHGGRHDFMRFSHLGHRRVFRRFSEIASGCCGGPGMALAWSFQSFVLSFVDAGALRDAITAFLRPCLFWLKYFDYYLATTKGGIDAASGTYFLGRKGTDTLSDRVLLATYKGAITDYRIT